MKQISLALLLVSLSTSPAYAQKNQSDREFQGFRGQVKAVTVERAEVKQLGNTQVEADRLAQKILTFDADGNLLSDKAYSQGEEFDIRTYSVIDGERVVKHDVLTKKVLMMAPPPGKKTGPPHDPRSCPVCEGTSQRFDFPLRVSLCFAAISKPLISPKSELWTRMYHFYALNRAEFLQHYHKRSNVETTFHMIKAKFGQRLRSLTLTAQINEALCKVLCHNLCVVIQSVHELGIEATFGADLHLTA